MKKTYIGSQSSIDLVSTLNQYEACGGAEHAMIVISSTAENLQFLRAAGVPERALRFMHFASRDASSGRRNLYRLVQQLREERRMVAQLAQEVCSDPGNELIFHSYDNDPHFACLVGLVAPTHTVTLIDVLGVRPQPLRTRQLLNAGRIKDIIYLQMVSAVFGRLFMLSGTPSYPIVSLDLTRVRVVQRPRAAAGTTATLLRYRYRIPLGAKNALVLYADSFGSDEQRHAAAYREMVDTLCSLGFSVAVKTHPQSRLPDYLNRDGFHNVPRYVPFEFVELAGIALVVGLAGASLLCTGSVRTVSLLKLLVDEHSDRYRRAMLQLSQNPGIEFVRSQDEFRRLARAVA